MEQEKEVLDQEVRTEENTNQNEAPENGKKDKKGKKDEKKRTPLQEVLSWIFSILGAVAIALVIRTLVFELIMVDGHSMDDTLSDHEIMFVTKMEYTSLDLFGNSFSLYGDPERFDVVICHYPNRGTTKFVKRVVGLPGDTVSIHEGYLYVNGEKYEEPYISDAYRLGAGWEYPEITVPEGQYFVMGDHRNNSNDSRYIGPLDRDMIIGHALQVLYPFSSWRPILNGLDW